MLPAAHCREKTLAKIEGSTGLWVENVLTPESSLHSYQLECCSSAAVGRYSQWFSTGNNQERNRKPSGQVQLPGLGRGQPWTHLFLSNSETFSFPQKKTNYSSSSPSPSPSSSFFLSSSPLLLPVPWKALIATFTFSVSLSYGYFVQMKPFTPLSFVSASSPQPISPATHVVWIATSLYG